MNLTPNELRTILKRCTSHEVTWQEVDRLKDHIADLADQLDKAMSRHMEEKAKRLDAAEEAARLRRMGR
jgi:exonuclease VII large subunit